jgi:hypothetical protein
MRYRYAHNIGVKYKPTLTSAQFPPRPDRAARLPAARLEGRVSKPGSPGANNGAARQKPQEVVSSVPGKNPSQDSSRMQPLWFFKPLP